MQTTAQPLVSIICLCYNQARFVGEALQSVLDQDYPFRELILVDDASTDDSVAVMEAFIRRHPVKAFIRNEVNEGNCRAFNRGLALAEGKYVVDLAADDVLLPRRLSRQVAAFEALDESYGLLYSNALRIDEDSREMGLFYTSPAVRRSLPQGEVFGDILQRAFICPPTMMMRKRMLDELGGYDESLSYEDFDLWVRSSRHYRYHYQDEVLTARREVSSSHSRSRFAEKSSSTLRVCAKAVPLCRNRTERQALALRIRHHLRQAFLMEVFEQVEAYAALLRQIGESDWFTALLVWAADRTIRLSGWYQRYLKYRYGFGFNHPPTRRTRESEKNHQNKVS